MGFDLKSMDANRACKLGGLLVLLMLVCWGVVLRSERLDYPPLDYPADRQKSYCSKIELFNDGVPLMAVQAKWLELRLLPWMVARTGFVAKMFDWEIWTQSRIYSVGFSGAMIFMLGLCGYLSGGLMGYGVPRRVLLGLIGAAMLVFNPFHIYLSRLIMTEPMTLCFQTGALLFLLLGMRRPKAWYFWLGCVAMLALAGLAKIPSFIWCPAIFLGFVLHPKVDGRLKLGGTVVGAVAILLVFVFYELNPLSFMKEFAAHYEKLDVNTHEWTGHPIWDRAYLGRVVMMLSLPVAVLAVIGCFVGPWIYRLTLLIFLVLFYRLLNLNTYNFAHIILPGTLLAAHGLDWLLNSALRAPWTTRWPKLQRLAGPADWAVRAVLLGAVVLALAARGPKIEYSERLRTDVFSALKAAQEEVPGAQPISYSDESALIGYYVNHKLGKSKFTDIRQSVGQSSTRYFYSTRRLGKQVVEDAANHWITWSSLHYEANGVLYDRNRSPGVSPNSTTHVFLDNPAMRTTPATDLRVVRVGVQKELFDRESGNVHVNPGDAIDLYVQWRMGDPRYKLGMIVMRSVEWGKFIPLPVNKGGLQLRSAGVLCLPQGQQGYGRYRVQIPDTMAPGIYYFYYDGIDPAEWGEARPNLKPFPLVVDCQPKDPAPVFEIGFQDAYPIRYDGEPVLWKREDKFKDVKLEGIGLADSSEYIVGLPPMPAGKYRLTLNGDGNWVTDSGNSQVSWPTVSFFLPEDANSPAGAISIESEKPADFGVEFTATEPFSSMLLQVGLRWATDGRFPDWIVDPIPYSYGEIRQQYLRLRHFKLEKIEDEAGA